MSARPPVAGGPADADGVLADPGAFLFRVDLARGSARFVALAPDAFQASVWLDYRIAGHTGVHWDLPLAALRDAGPPAPTAFLFHTAFCCSTLLARALQALPGTHVLREPLALRDLHEGGPQAVARWLGPVLAQLSKRTDPRAVVVIKPTNLVGALAPDLLAARPAARGLLLSNGADDWLVSCLKKPAETRARMPDLARTFAAEDPGLAAEAERCATLTPLEAMAAVWVLQRRAWARRLTDPLLGSRLRSLDAARLLAAPAPVLAAAAAWLGIAATPAAVQALVGSPVWRRNAKDPALPFDATQRSREAAWIQRQHAEDLREGRLAVEALVRRWTVPESLPAPLVV